MPIDAPFPDHRDLYLLVVGVLLGLVLSPAVLGNFAPDLRDKLFGATQPLSQLHDAFAEETAAQLTQLETTGVTDVAVQEHLRQRQEAWGYQVAAYQLALDRRAMGVLLALFAAVGLVMALEAWLSPQPDAGGRSVVHPAYRRLISTRYALLALIVAVVLARPSVLGATSIALVALTAGLALAVGLIPLGKPTPQAEP